MLSSSSDSLTAARLVPREETLVGDCTAAAAVYEGEASGHCGGGEDARAVAGRMDVDGAGRLVPGIGGGGCGGRARPCRLEWMACAWKKPPAMSCW